MKSQADRSGTGTSPVVVLEADVPEDRWIAVDLDRLDPDVAAKPAVEDAPTPDANEPAAPFGSVAPRTKIEGAEADGAAEVQPHNAQDLEPVATVAQLHGWLERLRPSDPGLLSFERPREDAFDAELPPPRKVPQADIILVGRSKEPPGQGPKSSFDRARAEAEMPAESTSCRASNDDAPGPGSRRRKLLLGLAVLIALTGALQAAMRLSQGPIAPAIVDPLSS